MYPKHKYLQQYKKVTNEFYHHVDKIDTEELLGWGSSKSQYLRFKVLIDIARRSFDLNPKDNLVDAGCGYGALLHFLQTSKQDVHYTGLDSSSIYIDTAKKRFKDSQFRVFDLLDDVDRLPDQYDVALVSGVLNLDLAPFYKDKVEKQKSKYAIVEHIIQMLCNSVRKGVVCNFLHMDSPGKVSVFNYHKPSDLIQHLESKGYNVIDREEGYLDNDFSLAIIKKN